MEKVSPDTHFLPQPGLQHLPCGVLVREWNYAVVYVRSPNSNHSVRQKFYFSFYATGDYYLDEVAVLVEQWTHYRGDSVDYFAPDTHEFRRARKMACQAVETYRRKYYAKHGSAPNPLVLTRTLDETLTPTQKKQPGENPDLNRFAQQSFTIDNKPL